MKNIARETIESVFRPDIHSFVTSLTNVDEYLCKITEYNNSLQQLKIHISHKEHAAKYVMIFRSVEYFEGPMIWIGANFSVGTFDEAISLLDQVAQYRKASPEDFLYQACLFMVGDPMNLTAKILAWDIRMGPLP